jgi:hypothetical protein
MVVAEEFPIEISPVKVVQDSRAVASAWEEMTAVGCEHWLDVVEVAAVAKPTTARVARTFEAYILRRIAG